MAWSWSGCGFCFVSAQCDDCGDCGVEEEGETPTTPGGYSGWGWTLLVPCVAWCGVVWCEDHGDWERTERRAVGGRDWSWSPLSSYHITPLFTFISPLSLPSSLLPPPSQNTQLLTNQWSFEWILSSYRNCLRWTYIQFKLTQYQVGMSNQIWFLFLWLLIVLVKGSINFLCFCILFLSVRDLKIQKIDISVVTICIDEYLYDAGLS